MIVRFQLDSAASLLCSFVKMPEFAEAISYPDIIECNSLMLANCSFKDFTLLFLICNFFLPGTFLIEAKFRSVKTGINSQSF